MVSKKRKKSKKKKKKKKKKIFFFYFFFTFLNWEKQTCYWEKKGLFSIGNGAKIRFLVIGRKGPEVWAPVWELTHFLLWFTVICV